LYPGLYKAVSHSTLRHAELSSLCSSSVKIKGVNKGQRGTRRRLHATRRKTLLSYYSEEEAAEIVKAAKAQGLSISNFVASAALKEAESINSQPRKRR
jgi:hypothetical protein